MKVFKRFLKIFGICFAILIGIVAIIVVIVAIQGGFGGNKVDVAGISFASSGGSNLVTDHTLDDYTATVYFSPANATEKRIKLALNKDGEQVVSIPSEVNAGEPFTIQVKKRDVYLNGQTYNLNVGGEAEITATDENNMFSCRLRLVVDIELPETGLNIISQNEYNAEEDYYILNRLSSGELILNVHTQPVNALYPNTNQVGAQDLGYRQVYLSENNSYSIVSVTPNESFYHEPTNTYFDYDVYKNEVRTDANGSLYLYLNSTMYTNLVRLRHLTYVLKISDNVGSTFNVVAKTFATYDMQQDYLEFERATQNLEQDRKFPLLADYLNKYKNIISKHSVKTYFNTVLGIANVVEENAQQFLQRVTNSSTGLIEINNFNDFDSALKYVFIEDSINYRVNEVQANTIAHTRSNIELDLYSDTFEDGQIYNLTQLSKQDLIKLFGISIRDQNNNLVDTWIGDVEVYSIKVDDISLYENDKQNYFNLFKELGVLKAEFDNNDVIAVTTHDGYTSIQAVNPESGSHSYLHIRIVRNPAATTYAEKYLTFNVRVNVNYTLASNISITNISELYTNTGIDTYPHSQELIIGQSDQTNVNVRVTANNASYTNVVMVALQEGLFLPTGQPKIRLGERVMLNSFMNPNLEGEVPEYAYMLPVNNNGNYYIEALNNTGSAKVKLMALIVKTDIDGNIIYDQDNKMVVTNNSHTADVTVSTVAEHIYFYSIDEGKYYKRNVGDSTITTNTLNMFVGGTYKLYISVFDIDVNGRIVMPQTDAQVSYVYNMLYAYNDMLSKLSNIKVVDSYSNEQQGVVNFSQYYNNTPLSAEDIQKLMLDASYTNTPIDALNYYNQTHLTISIDSELQNQLLAFVQKTFKVTNPELITITDIIPTLHIDNQAEVMDFLTKYYGLEFINYSDTVSDIQAQLNDILGIATSQTGDALIIEMLAKYISMYHLQNMFLAEHEPVNYATQYDQIYNEVKQAIISQIGQFDIINQTDDISSLLNVANLINVCKTLQVDTSNILCSNTDGIYLYSNSLTQLIAYITDNDLYRNLAINETSNIDEVVDALNKFGVNISNLKMQNSKYAIVDYIKNLQFNKILQELGASSYQNLDLMSLITYGHELNEQQFIKDYLNVELDEVDTDALTSLYIIKILNDNGYKLPYSTSMQSVAAIINQDYTSTNIVTSLDDLMSYIPEVPTTDAEVMTKLGLQADDDINEFMLSYYLGVENDEDVISNANQKVIEYAAKLKQIVLKLNMQDVEVNIYNTSTVLADAIIAYNIYQFNQYFAGKGEWESLDSVAAIIAYLKTIDNDYYSNMFDNYASNQNIFTIINLLNENGENITYLPQDATLNDLYTALEPTDQEVDNTSLYKFKTSNISSAERQRNFFNLADRNIVWHAGDTISIDESIGAFIRQDGLSTVTLTQQQIDNKTLTIYFKAEQGFSGSFDYTVTFGASSLINILNNIEGPNTLSYINNSTLLHEFYYVYSLGHDVESHHAVIVKPVLQDILYHYNDQAATTAYDSAEYLQTLHTTNSVDKAKLFVDVDITPVTAIERYGTRYIILPQFSTDRIAIMIHDALTDSIEVKHNETSIGGKTGTEEIQNNPLTFSGTQQEENITWTAEQETINITLNLGEYALRNPELDPTVSTLSISSVGGTAEVSFDQESNTITVKPLTAGETTISIMIGNATVWQIRVVCSLSE